MLTTSGGASSPLPPFPIARTGISLGPVTRTRTRTGISLGPVTPMTNITKTAEEGGAPAPPTTAPDYSNVVNPSKSDNTDDRHLSLLRLLLELFFSGRSSRLPQVKPLGRKDIETTNNLLLHKPNLLRCRLGLIRRLTVAADTGINGSLLDKASFWVPAVESAAPVAYEAVPVSF